MKNFSFKKPAVYRIEVYGDINPSLSERFGEMEVANGHAGENDSVSTLIGRINDQSALSGILNTLYENHITIVSVNILEES